MTNELTTTSNRPTAFKPGMSGNPNGRPVGSRNAFMADLADVAGARPRHGSALRPKEQRDVLCHLCAAIPRDVALTIETQLPGGLQPDDIAILRAIKEAIPNAGERSPQEVLEYVRDTLRAAEAKVISVCVIPYRMRLLKGKNLMISMVTSLYVLAWLTELPRGVLDADL